MSFCSYMTNLPSLADRRLYLKQCYLYKTVHNMAYFPPNIAVPKVTTLYNSTPFTLYQPFALIVFFKLFCTSCCIPLELTSRAAVVSSPFFAKCFIGLSNFLYLGYN